MLIIRLRGKMYFCFMAYYMGDLYVLSWSGNLQNKS